MSQEKTAVPGMGNPYSYNPRNDMYSRTSTHVNYEARTRGTVVPGMNQMAPGVQQVTEQPTKNTAPVVGFLYSISRQGIGEYWPVHIGCNKIGRSSDCDIVLLENTVSDHHANLNVKQLKTSHKILASIIDVGSKNGIFVNDEELDYTAHECPNNAIIKIGLNYQLLLLLIDAESYGLSVAQEFIPVEEEEPELPFQPQSNNFNPYDHNRRSSNTGTIAMDGSQGTAPGGTKAW